MVIHMKKTTLNIPEPLFRELKHRAIERGETMSNPATEFIRRGLKAKPDSKELPPCRRMTWVRSSSWFTTWSIIYEFMRVSTHRNHFEKPLTVARAWEFIRNVFASPYFNIPMT